MDSRGITLNGVALHDELGAETDQPFVTRVEGLGSAPWRGATGERAGTDGSWAATRHRAARTFTIEGGTVSPDAIASELWIDRIETACIGRDLPLTLHWASGPRTAMVRLDGALKIDRITPEVMEWQIPLIADDPAVYLGDGVTPTWTATTGRASEAGGVVFPLVFPLSWSSQVVGGMLAYSNPGTAGRLLLRLDGPLTDPTITTTNADGPRVLSWPMTLAAGEYLLIDPEKRQALLQGQASRPPAQRGWPRLTPGTNSFQFHAPGDSTGTLTVSAWAAY